MAYWKCPDCGKWHDCQDDVRPRQSAQPYQARKQNLDGSPLIYINRHTGQQYPVHSWADYNKHLATDREYNETVKVKPGEYVSNEWTYIGGGKWVNFKTGQMKEV